MPIYEYQCQKCGHDHEALQKISDAPLRKCPACGRLSLKRLVSAPRFRLAGSGWYETDFKSDKESKRNLVEKGEGKPPASDTVSSEKTSTSDASAAGGKESPASKSADSSTKKTASGKTSAGSPGSGKKPAA